MWAVCAFYSWLEEHNERSDEKCLPEVLCVEDKALLCHRLCIFVKEARREDGEEYTPRSISMLLYGLQRFINSKQEPHEPLVKLVDSRGYFTRGRAGFVAKMCTWGSFPISSVKFVVLHCYMYIPFALYFTLSWYMYLSTSYLKKQF